MIKPIVFASYFLLIFYSCNAQPQHPIEGVMAEHAMVVTAHPQATRVGLDILQKGGNAVDAAIAVQFALAVVYPNAGNIGGGGFMVLRLASGEINALDYREKAPGTAQKNMFLDSLQEVNRHLIERSQLASGVPGSVAGMWEAHQKYGLMSWSQLLQPAIDLAEKGFPLAEKQSADLNRIMEELDSLNENENYFHNAVQWKKGDTLKQPELATTLKQIQQHGRDGFYTGPVADHIVAEMNAHNGIISYEDLKAYNAVWRKPVSSPYKNYTCISMPPPSSGGLIVAQLLKMVEPFSLGAYGWNSTSSVHIMAEAEKYAYADRASWMGDPDFFRVPFDSLLDDNYLHDRMKNFDLKKVKPSSEIAAGKFVGYESDETTHFSIVDANGNAVSVTTTLNDSYGCRIFVTGAGFLLNNEMDDFSAKPGSPNLYGLTGGEANAIQPYKRMLSSMTPTIVLKDGNLFMVVGSPGGSTIITSVFQNIINVTEYRMNMQESVNAKRFHHQWLPDEILYEPGALSSQVEKELLSLGYTLRERSAIGRVDAILVHSDGTLEGAADPRGDDKAMGY